MGNASLCYRPEAFDVCSGLFCTSAYNLLAPRIVPELYESDNTKNETPGILQLNQEPQHWRAKITQALEKYDAEPGAIERILAGQDQWLRARALHRFDFVYCYGVLMHTGDLRTAAENIFALTHTGGGKLFFAIYNPHYWPEHKSDDYLQQKKEYLALPEWAKQVFLSAATSSRTAQKVLFEKYLFSHEKVLLSHKINLLVLETGSQQPLPPPTDPLHRSGTPRTCSGSCTNRLSG